MTLKELRKQKKLTQYQCAGYLGIPRRTYQNYENNASLAASFKYEYMMRKLERYGQPDGESGILSIQQIKDACAKILPSYDVGYCYLFGSYAKGKATEKSDVDLLVSTSVTGIRFYDLIEALREELGKKLDVLDLGQLSGNDELVNEILKDGIKVYG